MRNQGSFFEPSWLAKLAIAAILASIGCGGGPSGGSPAAGPDAGVDTGSGNGSGHGPDAGMGSDAGSGDGDVPFTNGASTLAGSSLSGMVDGSRAVARFSDPVNVVYHDGLLVVADSGNNRLRVINTVTHDTSTALAIAGFQHPVGLTFALDGTLYASTDADQNGGLSDKSGTIWKVDLYEKTATVVVGGIGRPRGIVALSDGRLAATDYLHHVIELIDPAKGTTTVIAGQWDSPGSTNGAGSIARFTTPYGIAVWGGQLLIADSGNNMLRLVALDGTTSTLSGATTPDFVEGHLADARFNRPQGVAVDVNGVVYVTDAGNCRIRQIRDDVKTLAGDGQCGYVDSDDPTASEFYGLEGLFPNADGTLLYVADGDRGDAAKPFNRVRQVKIQ